MSTVGSIDTRVTLRRGASILIVLAVAACAPTAPPPAAWETAVLADHPLVGRIWSAERKDFVPPAAVVAALIESDFVLLGEKHDNPDHHRLQAWAIRAMAARGRRLAIAFEMLDPGQEAALLEYLKANPGDAAGIGVAIGWTERGWPDWSTYRPVADAAIDAGAPMLAGAVERKTIRRIGREGFSALDPGEVADLGLNRPVPEPMRAEMKTEIAQSHCGYLPKTALDPMVDVQFAKDAIMARALQRGIALDGRNAAVLVAGTGHVRGDRGVPWHLRQMAPARVPVTIAFTEVRADETAAVAYERAGGNDRAFDFLWFTPRVDSKDPCDVFADQLRRMRDR